MKKLIARLKVWFKELFNRAGDAVAPYVPPVVDAPKPGDVIEVPRPEGTPPKPAPVMAPRFALGKTLHKGVWYDLLVPLNPEYEPGMAEGTIGGEYLGGRSWVSEDRLSRPIGARSPAGFPMWDGKVVFKGELFPSDAALADYIIAVEKRAANLRQWEVDFATVRFVGSSGFEATNVVNNGDELSYLREKALFFRGDLWRVVLSGSNVEIARCINDASYGAGERGKGVRSELILAVNAALARQAAGELPQYAVA